jgi:ESS family glutamate:Na+ symporter
MYSFVALSLVLGIGYVLRLKIRFLRVLYLPSCVIGGIVALILLEAARQASIDVPVAWTAGWSKLPGMLINVVFACLFLGVRLPSLRELWQRSSMQLCYGQIVAWGQYVVGVGLVLLVLGSLFGLPAAFGGILPVGFEGGHGTAAGLGPVFNELGWPEGLQFALASATFGIVSAIIVGMILVNWAVRRGHTVKKLDIANVDEDDEIGIIPVDRRPTAGHLTVSSDTIGALSLHIVVVAVAILIGIVLKQGLVLIEGLVPLLARHHLLSSFPLFPLCMLGGLVIQLFEDRYDHHRLIDVGLTRRIQNAALDFLVVAAIATIKLQVVLAGLVPLLILVAAGIAWNVFCVIVLAPRVFRNAWFERAIAEMGQSMGVTATGLLLLRVVDPDYETPAADAFACKQLLHEPFMGGGLWTGMAIPLLFAIGAWPVFLIACGAVVIWGGIIAGVRLSRRHSP